VQEANADNAIQVGLYPSRDDLTEARHATGISSDNHDDTHADELETSILLAAHPVYVRDGWQSSEYIASDRRYLTTLGKSAYTPSRASPHPDGPAGWCRFGGFGSDGMKTLVETCRSGV
jgi:creatinine amidohydrolase